MDRIQFSIIVPVYNCLEHLESCIESILQSGIDDSEVILVDDGSEDGSGDLCDHLASVYDSVNSFHIAHNGVAAARNFGIGRATRDYLLFVDGDDGWNRSFKLAELQKSVSAEKADLFVFRYSIRTHDGGQFKDDSVHWSPKLFNDWRDDQGAFLTYFPNGWMFPCWNKAFKREVIQKHGLCFHQQQMEDFQFVLEYLDRTHSVCFLAMEAYLYHKRADETSLTKSIYPEMLEGYNLCHEGLLSSVGKEYQTAVHQIMAPQYIATVNKCLISRNKACSRQLLDKVRKNPFAASSFLEYKASTSSERITIWLMRRGWFSVLKLYRRVVSVIKKANHLV